MSLFNFSGKIAVLSPLPSAFLMCMVNPLLSTSPTLRFLILPNRNPGPYASEMSKLCFGCPIAFMMFVISL